MKKHENKAKAAVEERLIKGESVISQAVIHDGIYWQAAALFVFSVIIALFLVVELGIFLAIVSGLMALHAMIKKSILLMVVTNKRILVRYGILQVDVVDIHFDKIESIELERMLPGYVMGYANIIVMGTGNRYIVIPYVANGAALRRAYNEQVLGDSNSEESLS